MLPISCEKESTSVSSAGDHAEVLGRHSEPQTPGPNGRERLVGNQVRPGHSGFARHLDSATQSPDPVPPVSISTGRPSSRNVNASNCEESLPLERPVAAQFITSWAGPESSSSSTTSCSTSSTAAPLSAESGAPVTETTGMAGVGLVVEILPVPFDPPEIVSSEGTDLGSAHRNITFESRNLWFEDHPPWNSRFGSSEASALDSSSSLTGLSETSRRNLQAVCESTLQQHRVNEMQERLRRYAGLPPSVNIQDLERRGILLSDDRRQRDGRSSLISGNERSNSFESPPAYLHSWDTTEESRPVDFRHSVYSESLERQSTFDRSDLQSVISDRLSTPPASSSTPLSITGRELRRNGGRRLWDTLTRAASNRRTSSPLTGPDGETIVESLVQNDNDHLDFGPFHGRSLDLEERRRRVRSQVWALQLLSNGPEGMSGFNHRCASGGSRHGPCTCEEHSSGEDSRTRASFSRIIMLAEALFEVLDEIHRQSLALSINSVPIASLPAPDTVVDAMPMKRFTKHLLEEATQCNICLIEYEEGDQMRILPCQHEYHVACVDKWLKEVHRVCPLCRGNVCELNAPELVSVST